MRLGYEKLGTYIEEVNVRNTDLAIDKLLGVSIQKILIPSIANTIGTDMSKYKVVKRNQFAYGPVTSRNGNKISIALLQDYDDAIISQSYKVFKVMDETELLPEYLMMWFRRPEFDRYARFMSHGSTRETFDWDEMCEVELPVPSPEKQQAIVDQYNTVNDRIKLNEQLNQKLEETAQAIYKHWFVDFEFPDENGKPYKSSGGEMVYNEELEKEIPEGWEAKNLGSLIETINGYAFKSGNLNNDNGIPILKISNVKPPYIDLTDVQFYGDELSNKLLKYVVNEGDILISMTGSGINQISSAVGQVGRYLLSDKSLLNQRVCKFAFKGQNFPNLLFYFLSSKAISYELLLGSTGSANQANISPTQIKSLLLAFPVDIDIVDLYESTISILIKKLTSNNNQSMVFDSISELLLSKMASN